VSAEIARLDADVVCLTEGEAGLLPPTGAVVDPAGDAGYPGSPGRRKLLLWSRSGWRDVDRLGDPALPPGRYVAGTTDTPLGEVRVVGVCVPWRDAHVRTGSRDRRRWEDHLAYLAALGPLLTEQVARHPRLVVAGDLNQRVPRSRQPVAAWEALRDALADLEVLTAGAACEGRALIDHLAVAPGMVGVVVATIPRRGMDGPRSDHDGVCVRLAARR
jgi:exonuclease III